MEPDNKKIFSIFDSKTTKLSTSPNVNKSKIEKNKSVTFNPQPRSSSSGESRVTIKDSSSNDCAPLAEKVRPNELKDYIGQFHLIGSDTILYNLLKNEVIPNMILWGPPGCGKTSLVNVIMKNSKKFVNSRVKFIKFSATTASIKDVKQIISDAQQFLKTGGKTVVFMDEIHRFNKLQQDVFLPHVEEGTFILIGATTENPSSSLNSALLSRCRVFCMNKLSKDDLVSILSNAVQSLNGKIIRKGNINKREDLAAFFIDSKAVDWLSEICEGDARVGLGALETIISAKVNVKTKMSKHIHLSLQDIKEGLEEVKNINNGGTEDVSHLYNAMHHCINDDQEMPALYWLARLIHAKEDPVNIARRLVRIASEDIGLAEEEAFSNDCSMPMHTLHACQMIGLPECDVILAQCIVYLSRAEKSQEVKCAFDKSQALVENHIGGQPKVPLFIKDGTAQKKLKYIMGENYENMKSQENLNKIHLPEGLEHVDFFN